MQAEQNKPLILTLRLDAESQSFFNEKRRQYFPADRNYLDAHLTLFHQLQSFPGRFEYAGFEMDVTGVYSMGNAWRIGWKVLLYYYCIKN